ncbi:MAG: O-methyltransferase, partial [Lachnospiraceae bacterium]|nr:O-methyltransferase [Lachnospiraceae bacterium]
HYAVAQRNRTIYKRMRESLYTLKHTEGLLTSIVAVGDGAAVTVKKSETQIY